MIVQLKNVAYAAIYSALSHLGVGLVFYFAFNGQAVFLNLLRSLIVATHAFLETFHCATEVAAYVAQFLVPKISKTTIKTISQCQMLNVPMSISPSEN